MLTTKQLKDIEALQKECEKQDSIQLKLNWDMLKTRSDNKYNFLLYDKDELIAFIGLYPFGTSVEICGMVKPQERRKQHFSLLFGQAVALAKLQGFHKVLLNAPAGSNEAKKFLRKIDAVYSFSEYQMEWQETQLDEVQGFNLHLAEPKDLPLRVQLNIEAFGLDEKSAFEVENRVDTEIENNVYIIDVQGESVGKIRVKVEDNEAWIYGFSILSSYRGNGIGRKVLQHIINKYSAQGCSVHLEVETENTHALKLYESIGFKVVHAQDYYSYS